MLYIQIVKYWVGKTVPSVSEVKVKDTVFIFTKDFIEQSIQFCSTNFLPFFRQLPKTFSIFPKLFVLSFTYVVLLQWALEIKKKKASLGSFLQALNNQYASA